MVYLCPSSLGSKIFRCGAKDLFVTLLSIARWAWDKNTAVHIQSIHAVNRVIRRVEFPAGQ
jgi:hypothetical protein